MTEPKKTDSSSFGDNSRYLQVEVGGQRYALPLILVKEVIAPPAITPLPQSKPHLLGLINLRKEIIPVIDFRKLLGAKPSTSAESAIVICDLDAMSCGLMVDSVVEVFVPDAGHISTHHEFPSESHPDYIAGVIQMKQNLILLIDLNKALKVDRPDTVLPKLVHKTGQAA